MNRNITGTIRKTDGTVWAGAVVEFELERSSYDQEAQYPSKPVRAVTDAQGELALVLWVNEEGLRPSKYICTLPDGSQFRFILPAHEQPIDIHELRESSIEEDSPTESQVIAFLPVMRQEARLIVEEELVPVNAEIDTKADQTALDATNANLAALDAEVDTKASQAALNTTNANLAALDAEVDTKADQTALDDTNTIVGGLEQGLENAVLAIATKANQSSLNTTNANVATLTTGLVAANTAIATKANQTALDATNVNVTTVTNGLASANTVIATKANQTALDATNANVTQLVQDMDTLSHEKADQSALDDAVASLSQSLDTKADQTALDDTNTIVFGLEQGLENANLAIATKASQSALNTTNANLAAANAAIATKANQSSLDTTNANVTTVTNGLAAANTAIATKASQADLDTANVEIAARARQTALNATNANLAALDAEVDTKVSQLALNAAITTLEDAISAAQTTLQNLIAQKADLVHVHDADDVRHSDFSHSIAYFGGDRHLAGSDQFTFRDGKLGLGTDNPEFPLDLRDPNAEPGNQSRISAILNSSSPILQLNSDSGTGNPTTIVLECAGQPNTIEADSDGNLSFGMEGTTPNINFRMYDSTTSFRGLKSGYSDPTEDDFPPYSFGFWQRVTHFGPHFVIEFDLVFNDGVTLYILPFNSSGNPPLDP